MSTVENLNKDMKILRTQRKKGFCDHIKAALIKTFLFVRYYFDLLTDYIFGYFNDYKRVPLKKCTNPIILQSATTLARKIKQRELTSEEVVQAYIDRIKEVNPIINAIVDSRYEAALGEARQIDKDIAIGNIKEVDFQEKPFLGVPFTTKETTAVEGMSFTFGIVKRKGRKALFDAEYVKLIKKAGAICLGVTNIPQLSSWNETYNPIYGVTNNPYNTTRNVGGSSGGEASILAAGGTAISLGTDIGGSIRSPAFCCGVFGVKPTPNLISITGTSFRTGEEEQTIVSMGLLARHAVDIAPILGILVDKNIKKLRLDEPVNVKSLKINYVSNPNDILLSPPRQEMIETFSRAVNHFKDISNTPPEELVLEGLKYSGKLWKYWYSQESGVKFLKGITDCTGEARPLIETIKYLTGGGDYTFATICNFINSMIPAPKASWAVPETEKLKQQLLDKLGNNGVLLYPSAPFTASHHYANFLRPMNLFYFAIWNALKFPAIQVPMGLSKEGLPIGIQVVAAPYQEHLCIAVAKELEEAFGGYVPPFET